VTPSLQSARDPGFRVLARRQALSCIVSRRHVAWLDTATLTGLGAQGILLNTIDDANTLIVGGPDNGTLYAAYQFIEDALGVRFLAPDYTHIPDMPASIPCVNHRFAPPFEYRYSTNFSQDPNVPYYRQVHRFNPGPGFSCHTYYALLPPEQHFNAHPEYYSLVFGERIAPVGSVTSTIETIANDRYEIWVAPKAQGTILRWRDKKLGVEWLRGYETYGRRPGQWQDWTIGGGIPEGPVADRYDVVSRTNNAITLRTTLPDGMTLDRVMTLSGDAIEVALICTNSTSSPQVVKVKTHPEFWTQGENRPEVWSLDGKTWSLFSQAASPDHKAWGRLLHGGSIQQAAFYLPKQKIGVAAVLEGSSGFQSFFNINKDAEHVNLEILPSDAPLAPGESQTTKTVYSVIQKRPATKK